ncbi:MAG: hypothetical protein E7773_08075 [Sphingomonas sp.]|uniref:hypothetical protein n=1 Tax=Sphingomonas sp. TaxID=28214 RepID=UPI00121B724E|nr:hypothetical protein [Sphingomonas sp.]THD35897.1 MAG: hypothetical protein E7773_08075 [Sphingomonas sp.]
MRSIDTKLALAAALALLAATPAMASNSPAAASSTTAAGLGMGTALGFCFLIIGVIALVAGVLRRLSRPEVAVSDTSGESYRATIGDDPFEARLAARLAELQNGGETAEAATVQPAPVAISFGRKQV